LKSLADLTGLYARRKLADTMTKPKRKQSVDLSEYAEEAVPFDNVIRTIAKAKPKHRVVAKTKAGKTARRRK